MVFSDDLVVVARDKVAVSSLPDGAALLDLEASRYFSLNKVGALIWTEIASPVPVANLLNTITDQFDVSPDVARADLTLLLAALADACLIKIVDEPVA